MILLVSRSTGRLLAVVGCVSSFGWAAVSTAAESQPPRWIWVAPAAGGAARSDVGAGRSVRFSRSFTPSAAVVKADLRFAADFCAARIELNGRTVLDVEPYCRTQTLDVTDALRRGENRIVVEASTVAGPSAVALSLTSALADGSTHAILTGADWSADDVDAPGATAPVLDLGQVRPELWGVGRCGIEISPLENYEQWQQAQGAAGADEPKFQIVPGFEIRRLRTAAPDEGSWIALAFDGQGRLTVSREDRGLLRMTLADDRRSVARVETIDVDLQECRGLLYDGDTLLANANNSRGLYRLKLTDDGRAEDVRRLREFPGMTGHGRNGLALGPGGELYSIHGDAVDPPTTDVLDRTSPLRDSRRGKPQQEAYLVRTDRDGRRWELVCTGLRNPYGVAVNAVGDAFTYDADNEYDMGTPWYRPTRIVQLFSGADYGYRSVNGRWPPNFPDRPDHALPTIDIGRGSPTAALFGASTSFPAPYREALFVLDWTYGRVIAVHLAPHGAGYRPATELFLQGKPLNVTDAAAGPDGAMYLITGGRKTQSALYRVAWQGPVVKPPARSAHESAAAAFAEERRTLRRRLERFHGTIDGAAVDEAWPYLGDADPVVRHAARIAVECQPSATWLDHAASALGEGLQVGAPPHRRRAALAAGLMLARLDPSRLAPAFASAEAAATPATTLSEAFERAYLLRACAEHSAGSAEPQRRAIAHEALKLWPRIEAETRRVAPQGDDRELRRRAALLLGDVQAPQAVGPIVEQLFTATQEDRLTGLLALRNLRAGWTPARRRAYFETLDDGARFVGGEGLPTFLRRLRSEAAASLSAEERAVLGDSVDEPRTRDVEPVPPPRPVVRHWTFDELADQVAGDSTPGDARRGAEVFRAALCNRCHRAGLVGPAVGPDLTFVARRFGRRDLLQSIVTPSASVAENYRNVEVVTEDGRTYVGRMVAEGDFRSEKLLLSVDPLRSNAFVEVDKRQIVDSRTVPTSPMPQGLLDPFTLAEIRDLLAFLESSTALD